MFENLVQLTLRQESVIGSDLGFFKFLFNLEVLEIQYHKLNCSWFTLIYGFALIPSKKFQKLKAETNMIDQKDLEQIVGALKQRDQPITV